MIIKEIYIDGFGIFHNYGLKGLTKGVNIIEGENEAGKSTFLNFIRYTFFGYPNRTSDRYEPLRSSAAHGGRIVAELANGKQAVFERAAGGKGGKIQLHYEHTVSAEPSQWSLLLGNANLQLFQSVYGFTLYELIGFDNLENSGIDDKIFSLGIGVTNVSIGELENKLISKAENIYKREATNRIFPGYSQVIEVN